MKVVSNNILAIYWEQFHFPRNSTTLFEIDLPADLLLFAGKAGAPRSLNELPLETEVRSLFFIFIFQITITFPSQWRAAGLEHIHPSCTTSAYSSTVAMRHLYACPYDRLTLDHPLPPKRKKTYLLWCWENQ